MQLRAVSESAIADRAFATAHAMTWTPLPGAIAIAAAIVLYAGFRVGSPDASAMAAALREATLFFGIATTSFLDDPAVETVAPSPVVLLRRYVLRSVIVGVPLVLSWAALVIFAGVKASGSVPWVALSLEAMGLAVLGGAAGGLVARWGWPNGWGFAAAALFVCKQLLIYAPSRWSLYAGVPGDAMWREAHLRWMGLIGIAFLVLAALSRDPAAKRFRLR